MNLSYEFIYKFIYEFIYEFICKFIKKKFLVRLFPKKPRCS